MAAAVGLRVIRGPGWSHGDADDGEGHVGTIVAAGSDEQTHVVTWDGGQQTTVKAGSSDLRVLDNATIGICHPHVVCDECEESDISGMRWKCSDCHDYDLCSMCYFNDSHDMTHQFDRIEIPECPPVRMEKRSKSMKMGVLGIYPDATVVRGRDWDWSDQDGGNGKEGTVLELLTPGGGSARSTVRVKWETTDTRNVYRMGYKGKVDLQYTEESPGGECYPQHLPVFNISTYKQAAVVQTAKATTQSDGISIGDMVYIDLPSDKIRELRQTGGETAQLLGRFGRVVETTSGGEILAVFGPKTYRLSRNVVQKVRTISVGDRVKVLSDEVKVAAFQNGHGGYNANMRSSLGKVGQVVKVDSDGDVEVQFEGQKWCYSPICLTPAPGQAVDVVPRGGGGGGGGSGDTLQEQNLGESGINVLGQLFQALAVAAASAAAESAGGIIFLKAVIDNELSAVRQMLQKNPALVGVKHEGLMAIHLAANQGHVKMTQLLVEKGAKMDVRDKDGDTALTAGAKYAAVAEYLINKGCDVNAANNKGLTASILAAAYGHTQILRLLAAKGADFNAQDKDGDTPLHLAIEHDRAAASVVLIGWQRIDLRRKNKKGFSPLLYTASKGKAGIAEFLLRKDRSLVNEQKDDGFAALHVAAINNHTAVMKVLIEKGQANVNMATTKKHTALHVTAQGVYMEATQLLIKHGADVEAKDCDGDRPLHILLCSNTAPSSEEALLLLLLLGQVPRAKVEERVRLACCLLQAGASPQARNNKGKTALEQCDNQAIVEGVKRFLAANPSLNRPPGSAVQVQAAGQQCQRCSSRRANVLLVPCGHRVVCTQCCAKLQSCPQCYGTIKNMYDETGKDMKDKCSVM